MHGTYPYDYYISKKKNMRLNFLRNILSHWNLLVMEVCTVIYCSHLFQTSMTVKQKLTTAALKQFLTAPRDPLIAHASLDIKEMDITVQVLFEAVWSFRSALFRNVLLLFGCFCCCSFFFAGFSCFISCEACGSLLFLNACRLFKKNTYCKCFHIRWDGGDGFS